MYMQRVGAMCLTQGVKCLWHVVSHATRAVNFQHQQQT